MKPTILYIITQDFWGGAQRYLYDLLTRLDTTYRIVFAIGEKATSHGLAEHILNFKKEHSRADITIIQLKYLKRDISLTQDGKAVLEIRKLYNDLKPDIIHLNSTKAGIIGSFAARGLSIPIVYTVHGWVFKESLSKFRTWIYILLEKITAKYKKKFILLSEEDKNEAVSILHIPLKKLELIPLGIGNTENYLPKITAQKELHINDPDITQIGVIANFYRTKGIDVLLDALTILSNKKNATTPYHVHVIGDGAERATLTSHIKKYNLTHTVTLHGFISNAEKLLTAFNLIIIPSRKEGLPYILLECVQASIPVIATSVGGIASFSKLTEGNITVIESEKPEQLALAIEKVLSQNPISPTHKRAFLPDAHTLTHMVKKTQDLYTHLLSKAG